MFYSASQVHVIPDDKCACINGGAGAHVYPCMVARSLYHILISLLLSFRANGPTLELTTGYQ